MEEEDIKRDGKHDGTCHDKNEKQRKVKIVSCSKAKRQNDENWVVKAKQIEIDKSKFLREKTKKTRISKKSNYG